ncbi:MAG: thiamine pyrophosphate-dependent enzyme [Patescibacteria group bacterium]
MHACRRNIDITYIVLNNENYGLTTGQASPTTPIGAKTSSTPAGNLIKPFDPVALAKA